jgi:hypothetical protein
LNFCFKAARSTVASLRKARDNALSTVKLAAGEISKANSQSEGAAYGEEKYWDQRYQGGEVVLEGAYEWYLSFADLKEFLIPEIHRYGSSARVLVSGCGNSSLCENLAQCGQYLENEH